MLYTTFTLLREASYDTDNRQLSELLADMEGSAQNAAMGDRDAIATVEEIEAALKETRAGI